MVDHRFVSLNSVTGDVLGRIVCSFVEAAGTARGLL